jgi:hypothetical protein
MFSIRIASILLWSNGVGFGLPCLLTIRNLLTGRDLPVVMGFRAFGGGSFERAGTQTMSALLAVFFIVCILDCIAGWLLWSGHRSGAILSLILVPVGAVFWWGFALPFPPIFAVVRTLLIVLSWRVLK